MRRDYDGLDDKVVGTPDLQKNAQGVDTSNSVLSKDSYSVTIENLPVKLVGKYNFVFNYYYKNPDDTQTTPVLGPPSATYSIELTIPDLSEAPTNVVAVGGVSSYTVSWDKPTFKTYGDTIVYESDTNSFNSSSKVVFVGTDNQCSVITSDYNNKWVYVVHRDIFREAHKKGTVAGPITIKTADPDTTFTVANPGSTSASASIDPKDLSGFSLVSNITWAQSTDTKTAGYAIRWSTDNPANVATPLWEYASVSGKATTSFTATGLIPNTTYYYQVASTTPYDVVNWTGAASGTFIASDADGTAAGALARLKSYIAIGGASQDLFKIGTGISQSINLNTDPLTSPTLTSGTYHGIILNKSTTNVGNNFWLTTGQFRVGNPTEFMYWNGTNLYLTGNINATGGKFTGNVQLAIPDGATTSGTLYAGSSPTSGTRVRFNSEGIFGYDASGETFKLQSSDGLMTATKGQIAGWTLDGTKLSKNNARLDSTGVIELGVSNTDNIVRLDANDATYRLWIGRNSSATAPFKVTKEGILYATGAVIGLAAGSTIDGYATTASLNNYTLTTTTTAINNRLSAVEGSYVNNTTLNTNIATKNAIFVQDNTPTATKVGDLWIDTDEGNIIKTWTGSSWTQRVDTTYATKTSLDTKLEAGGYAISTANNQITNITSNGIFITPGVFKISNTNESAPSTGSYLLLNSAGMTAYNGTKTTFAISSSGTAQFSGSISASTFDGGSITIGVDEGSSGYINTLATKGGITTMVIKAIGHASTSTSGWTTSCYPWDNATYSLGTSTYSWNNLYLAGSAFFANGTTIKIDGNGYATLNRMSLTGGYGVYSDWSPGPDSTYSLGLSSRRWQDVWAIDTSINASDLRYKKDILDSNLGLSFIKNLRPISYKWKEAKREVVLEESTEIIDVQGDEKTEQVVMLPKILGYDEDGREIVETVSSEGSRNHYGFIAQEVKEALDLAGVGDSFAGWVLDNKDDPESGQNLRYSEFIAPLTKAVQELSDMVESLQQEVNTLKGI